MRGRIPSGDGGAWEVTVDRSVSHSRNQVGEEITVRHCTTCREAYSLTEHEIDKLPIDDLLVCPMHRDFERAEKRAREQLSDSAPPAPSPTLRPGPPKDGA